LAARTEMGDALIREAAFPEASAFLIADSPVFFSGKSGFAIRAGDDPWDEAEVVADCSRVSVRDERCLPVNNDTNTTSSTTDSSPIQARSFRRARPRRSCLPCRRSRICITFITVFLARYHLPSTLCFRCPPLLSRLGGFTAPHSILARSVTYLECPRSNAGRGHAH